MKKTLPWIKWLAKVALSAALVSLITIVTTWFIVGSVVTQLLHQFQLPANLMPKVQISDVFAGLFGGPQSAGSGPQNAAAQDRVASPTPHASAAPAAQEAPSPQASPPGSGAGAGTGATAGSGATPPADAAAPAWEQRGDIALSEEQLAQTKRSMTDEDKMKLFTLVAPRMSDRDMQKLSAWMENGLTHEEMTNMREMLQKQLPPKDYEELLAILTKYAS